MYQGSNTPINNWKEFASKIRAQKKPLLSKLACYPDSILVAGCQRSGTTILSSVIASSKGVVDFTFSKDNELDAALILFGHTPINIGDRYCFQTTYLNENYSEYYSDQLNFKLIWLIRNPYSVVYSILYHWKRFAFNELFDACGKVYLNSSERVNYEKWGTLSISRIKMACLAYIGKASQLFEIHEHIGNKILVVDYDDLVTNKSIQLEEIYRFLNIEYQSSYGELIHSSSVDKSKKLTKNEVKMIDEICMPIYTKSMSYILSLNNN